MLVEELSNGIIFEWVPEDRYPPVFKYFKLTEMTMVDFNRRVRPSLDDYLSSKLQTINDVYMWYRKMVGIS